MRHDHLPPLPAMSPHAPRAKRPRRLAAVAVFAALLVAAALAPATTMAGDEHRWIRNMTDGYCLDSNAAGTVYVNPCQRGNAYQKWQFYNGGWTRNVATGRCLENPSYITFGAIRTRPCAYTGDQYWQHWTYGWFQRYPHAGDARPGCLAAHDKHSVDVVRCGDPYNPYPFMSWYTQLA